MKENIGFILFIVFVVIFILLLTGGRIIKSIKDAKIKAKKAADEKEQKYRDETGRQQRQYHYSGKTPKEPVEPRAAKEKPQVEEPEEIHTQTATGETIIDRRKQRCYEVSQWENVYPIQLANGEYRYRKSGYLRVSLLTEHGRKVFYVHRLVALVCCPNDDPELKTVVDHRDNNRQNNLPSNLEWVTPECNQQRLRQSRGWKPYSDKQREQARRQFARCSRAHWIRKQRLQESNLFE